LVALRAALVAAPLLASRDDVVDSQEQNCGFNSRFVNLARTNILEFSLTYHMNKIKLQHCSFGTIRIPQTFKDLWFRTWPISTSRTSTRTHNYR
jgi:hypothetical protein